MLSCICLALICGALFLCYWNVRKFSGELAIVHSVSRFEYVLKAQEMYCRPELSFMCDIAAGHRYNQSRK
jgi:hypothetical protein